MMLSIVVSSNFINVFASNESHAIAIEYVTAKFTNILVAFQAVQCYFLYSVMVRNLCIHVCVVPKLLQYSGLERIPVIK